MCSVVVLPFVPLPLAAAWPMAIASVVIHFGYYLTLAQAYRTGDLSFAYPLMRGTAPLLVTLLGIVFLRELPSPQVAIGVVLICAASSPSPSRSVTTIRARPCTGRSPMPRSSRVYTLVDGAGARASGNALSYVVWLTFFEGIFFLAWIRWRRGAAVRRLHRARSGGAACSAASAASPPTRSCCGR